MDNVRNMVGSPIAGIDPLEMVDTRSLCEEINNMITADRTGNPELTNLPRKINIAISGGRDDFAHTMINDIGLQPHVNPSTGEVSGSDKQGWLWKGGGDVLSIVRFSCVLFR